jgi:hypothetical protein
MLATCLLDGLLNYSSTLKMEVIRSFEKSGATQRTTRRHIPEDDALHNHSCENLKSYNAFTCLNCIASDVRMIIKWKGCTTRRFCLI